MQIEAPPVNRDVPKPDGERRGLVIEHTGDGQGKSTAAFGLTCDPAAGIRSSPHARRGAP